jgi:transcriptional regulator with XRE-family HTH domain
MMQSVYGQMDKTFASPAHIRSARAFLGWNLDVAANKSGISRDTISRYERGAVGLTSKSLARLVETFAQEGIEVRPDGLRIMAASDG